MVRVVREALSHNNRGGGGGCCGGGRGHGGRWRWRCCLPYACHPQRAVHVLRSARPPTPTCEDTLRPDRGVDRSAKVLLDARVSTFVYDAASDGAWVARVARTADVGGVADGCGEPTFFGVALATDAQALSTHAAKHWVALGAVWLPLAIGHWGRHLLCRGRRSLGGCALLACCCERWQR